MRKLDCLVMSKNKPKGTMIFRGKKLRNNVKYDMDGLQKSIEGDNW